jgi:transposase-like protein
LQKKSSGGPLPRIPPACGGIQVNFCKNPACEHYGIPAAQATGRGAQRDRYTVVGAGRQFPVLKCHACGEYPPLKSNQGIAEERERLGAYLSVPPEPSCPDVDCANHGIGVSTGSPHYRSYGTTRSGSKRYRCNACTKTFAVGYSTVGQKQPHKNRLIFQLLMNKTPFRRLCEIADIAHGTLYPKLDFLHHQCLAFAGHRERRLLQGFSIPRLYLGVDRQDYVVNWTQREDKRNVQLTAVGSADNATRYVFGMHLNFDPEVEAGVIEHETATLGDCERQMPFRRHARLWLASDYAAARQRAENAPSGADGTLNGAVAARYQDTQSRSDVEVFEEPGRTTQLPKTGMQVHAEYTLYGHCFLLRELSVGAEKVRLFLDQDSGMRAAVLGAFAERVTERTADAFYVRINKDMTVDERKHALKVSRERFRALAEEHPELDRQALRLLIIKEALADMSVIGHWKDRWLTHPFPSMSEPEKAVCYLTDYDDYDEDHLAWLYNKASLRAIDAFFMQVRRRLSLLERPIATASNNRRLWHGYSAYNPRSIVKLLEMFRVFYNYVLIGMDKQTPAMRLGLAKGRVSLEDIIYFQP